MDTLRCTVTSKNFDVTPEMVRKLGEAVQVTAQEVVKAAQRRCPAIAPKTSTGHLRNSIHITEDSAGLKAEVVASADYAMYVELGTVKMEAQPFLTPGLQDCEVFFNEACKQALES